MELKTYEQLVYCVNAGLASSLGTNEGRPGVIMLLTIPSQTSTYLTKDRRDAVLQALSIMVALLHVVMLFTSLGPGADNEECDSERSLNTSLSHLLLYLTIRPASLNIPEPW